MKATMYSHNFICPLYYRPLLWPLATLLEMLGFLLCSIKSQAKKRHSMFIPAALPHCFEPENLLLFGYQSSCAIVTYNTSSCFSFCVRYASWYMATKARGKENLPWSVSLVKPSAAPLCLPMIKTGPKLKNFKFESTRCKTFPFLTASHIIKDHAFPRYVGLILAQTTGKNNVAKHANLSVPPDACLVRLSSSTAAELIHFTYVKVSASTGSTAFRFYSIAALVIQSPPQSICITSVEQIEQDRKPDTDTTLKQFSYLNLSTKWNNVQSQACHQHIRGFQRLRVIH